MRTHTAALEDVLRGDFTRRVYANVFHGAERVISGLQFTGWSLDSDIGGEITHNVSGTIMYQSVKGESLSPIGTSGDLSPFRARLELVMEVTAGDFSEAVSLGMYRMVKMPRARDVLAMGGLTAVSEVSVELRSLDEDVRRRGLRSPEQPPQLESCYEEIRRLTGMPLVVTVSDTVIPVGTVWEAKQGGRLEAVHKLGSWLGGTAVVNSAGAWEIIPDELGSPVGSLWIGEQGTVLEIDDEIDTDDVYNEVVGVFEDENRNPIYAVATIDRGDLATDGLYGPMTRYYSSDFVKTQAQADAAVASVRDQSISSRTYDLVVQCHIDPTVEVGDVRDIRGWTRHPVGRVVAIRMGDSAYMTVTLRVRRDV